MHCCKNNASFMDYSIFQLFILFVIYSFLGWIIEFIYRTYEYRTMVNPGFMYGPIVPIYGIGAFFVLIMNHLLPDIGLIVHFIIYGIILSLLEYIVGYMSEKFMKIKLWDYSDSKFNLHGRVALLFSVAWAFLAVVFVYFIHPKVLFILQKSHYESTIYIALFLLVYFIIDLTISIARLSSFRDKLLFLFENYINLDNEEIEKIVNSIRRFLKAFPDLNKKINIKLRDEVNLKVQSIMDIIKSKFRANMDHREPYEDEYYLLVNDILDNSEFQRLKDFFHHNSSIYEHVLDVSYLAYSLCKYLKLDYRSAARGGLLHDFFLYDWRNHDEPDLAKEKFHGLWHSKIALKNAQKHFDVNKIEKDIILKHMWPLTLSPPRYKESFIVNFSDKYVSSREYLGEIQKGIKKKIKKSVPN